MKKSLSNPFVLSGYAGPDYFCDRDAETEKITKSMENGQNITLISPRRMGKSRLIDHVFYRLKASESIKIYADIFPTNNLQGFVNVLSNAWIRGASGSGKRKLAKVLEAVKSFHPIIRLDPFTGLPEIEITARSESEKSDNLENLFYRIGKEENPVVIAIDEFQQVLDYPEENVEALLRSAVQKMPAVRFIFSGSRMHLMNVMFSQSKHPFYRSTRILVLDRIDPGVYNRFITEKFSSGKRIIEPEAIDWLIRWTRGHTYYVQNVCNWLYGEGYRLITPAIVSKISREILLEMQPVFGQYRTLLTSGQYDLLRAIALEGSAKSVLSGDFIQAHNLGAASSVRAALLALIDKDMIREFPEGYLVDDVFFSRWLEESTGLHY